MKRHLGIIWLCLIVIILGSIGAGLMLKDKGAEFQVTMTLSVMAVSLNLLAVPFFLLGTRQFKAQLRRAYIFLCFGIGIFGLAQIQLPLISILDLGFWINSGGLAIPYLLGVIGIFYGMRAFTALLRIKSSWTSPLIAFIVTILLSLGATLFPHVKVAEDDLSFYLALALSIWNSVFITFAAVMAFLVRARIGAAYTRSMNWLCTALSLLAFAGWHYSVVQLTMTTGDWYYDYSLTIVPFLAGAFVLLIAGYTFNTTDAFNTKDKRGSEVRAKTQTSSLQLDVVVYVASLASRPTDIDVTLDTVRLITSRLRPGQALLPADKHALATVYQKLEKYLMHDDPLRKFSQEELRSGITKKFKLTDDAWALLWKKS